MRVLVCGGRDYANRERVFEVLDKLHAERGIDALIHGAARGADTLAAQWVLRTFHIADVFKCDLFSFPANWDRDGYAAGPIRNRRMLDEGKPDLVVAFPGGKGTEDCVRQARKAGVEVMEVVDG
ncbi:MAG: DUF2493 domain-containing protein [bacterium]